MRRSTIRSLYLGAMVLALTALMWWGTGIAPGTPPSVVDAQSKVGDVPPDRRATPSIIKARPLTNDSSSPIAVGSTGVVDPLSPAGPWTVVAPLPSARYANGGAGDGTFYYSVGGSNIASMVPDVFRYDPVGDTWISRAPIPTAVQDAPVVFAGGKLYVFGGLNSNTNVVYDTTQIYDIAGNTWSTGAPMPAVRFGSYVGLFNGKIYVAGGFLQNDINTGQNQTWQYNIAGNTWQTKSNMPNVNALGSYAVIGQLLYTFAGWRGNPCCDTDSYRYDMASDVWTTVASLPVGLEGTAAAVDNGKILIYGGGAPFSAQNTTYVYDPGTNTYSTGPTLNQVRVRFAGGNAGSFAIAVAGYTGSNVTNSTERSAAATCPPATINGTLGSGSPNYPSTSGTQTNRLFRGGVASACGAPNSCSTLAGTFNYDAYTFVNNSGASQCVTTTLNTSCTGTGFLFAGAYLGSFNPASICTNNIGDPGQSPNGAPVTFAFTVPAGATFVVVVSEVTAGGGVGCAYTLQLSQNFCGGGSCSLTCPGNITKSNDPNQCGAFVTYPAPTTSGTCGTVTCVPASGSFFPVGTTTVTCTAAPPSAPDTKLNPGGFNSGGGKAGSSDAGIGAGIPGTGAKPTTSSGQSGAGGSAPALPQSPTVVLYDQTDNPASLDITSQNFETAFDAFDDQAADDFVVPGGQTWTIQQIFVDGEYTGGPAASVNVFIYANSGTLPGGAVYTATNQTIGVDAAGDFTINLAVPAVLASGTYWLSVQANQNFSPNGQWFWRDRTVQSNSGAAWQNPGGGFGFGCATFGRKTTCIPSQAGNPDQIFQLLGTSQVAGGGATCTFTVMVQDTQPPVITCPGDITAVTDQSACPSPPCQVVTFPPPVATDNCPGVTVVCNPPSGVCFPVGTTTVTCTATDASGNTTSCSFRVTVFDVVLQDDSDPSIILLWNSLTGQYRFCCLGVTYVGVGKATRQGCVYTLETPAGLDRRLLGRVDKAVHVGSGSLQAPPGHTRCTITDRNTLNDTLLPACQ